MKVAVYRDGFGPYPDHFMETFDCNFLDDVEYSGEAVYFFDGKCFMNQECRDEASVLYDGYGSSPYYCICLTEHERRQKQCPYCYDKGYVFIGDSILECVCTEEEEDEQKI